MPLKKNPVLLLGIFLFFHFQSAYTQCLNAPPLVVCTGTEPQAVNGEIITVSVSKWFYSPAAVFSNLTLRGGKLTVCSDLTLQNFTIDSGTIVVQPGARLRIEGGNGLQLFGNCRIYNHGRLEITRNLSMENHYATAAKPNVIINAAGAHLDMMNQYFVINNPFSFLVNRGKADFHGIITDPGSTAGCVCLGDLSQTFMTVLHNRTRFSYASPEGLACVNVSEFSQLWDTLTNYASISMCLGVRHRMDSACMPWGCRPNAWGPASIFRNCASCAALLVLPVKIFDLGVAIKNKTNLVTWKSDMADPGYGFLIERSTDGINYHVLDTTTNLSFEDQYPPAKAYYRVTCMHMITQSKSLSRVIMAIRSKDAEIAVYPNPFSNVLYISAPVKSGVKKISLIDSKGRMVCEQKITPEASSPYAIKPALNLPAGVYFIKIETGKETLVRKVYKEK